MSACHKTEFNRSKDPNHIISAAPVKSSYPNDTFKTKAEQTSI